MTASPEGTIYLADLHDLIRISLDGSVRTLVKNLADHRRSFLFATDVHAIMGLWTDRSGNVYAAVMSDRVVKKVAPDGRVEVVARAQPGWTPTGVAPNGDLWLLEFSSNDARARRIDHSEIGSLGKPQSSFRGPLGFPGQSR